MQSDAGFPWWALTFTSGTRAVALLLFGQGSRKSEMKAAHPIVNASYPRSVIDRLDD